MPVRLAEVDDRSTEANPLRPEVIRVDPPLTFGLRQRVLRPGRIAAELALAGDDDPLTATYAVVDPDSHEVIATGNIRLAPVPFVPPEDDPPPPGLQDRQGGREWRIRGMATSDDQRSRGLGTAVLEACIGHVAANGGGILWCYARSPARSLYERAGLVVHGEEWVDDELGPHVAMWRRVQREVQQ